MNTEELYLKYRECGCRVTTDSRAITGGEMFVYTDTLPPGVALWLPNLLFMVVAYFLYKRACK